MRKIRKLAEKERMTKPDPSQHTAVSWHSVKAQDFDDIYRHNVNFHERFAVWSAWIEKYAKPGFVAADLGSGSGVFTMCLAAKCKHVTAIDASDGMIALAREKTAQKGFSNIDFVLSPIEAAGDRFPQAFDLVTCSSVVEYLDDLDLALSSMAKMVKAGGTLVISSPNRRSVFRRIEPYLHKYIGRPRYYRFVKNVLTREDMRARLERQGFEIIEEAFYARTIALSLLFRKVGLREYADNMFAYVCKKKG